MGLKSPNDYDRQAAEDHKKIFVLFGLAYQKPGFFYQDGLSNLQELPVPPAQTRPQSDLQKGKKPCYAI